MVATTGTILFGPGTLTATQTVIATVVYVGVSMAVTSALHQSQIYQTQKTILAQR